MIEIIDNESLKKLCEEMNQQAFVALDTEFIRERTYFPILALLQFSWKGRPPILVDPLEIDDWEPLHEVLKNPEVTKLFHAGRQDLEIFFHQMGEVPVNLFDTQIAASMCGYGDQIGYGSLVSRLLGVQLAKGSSYTNWLQRPLTESQLKYARDDVLYLPDVYEKLEAKGRSRKRLKWIYEEMETQLHEKLFDPDPSELWRKVKRSKTLKPRDTPVLQELAGWRDEIARKVNRPVRFILSDEAMLELAKIDKLTLENLRSRRGVQAGFVDRYGEQILNRHQKGRERPRNQWPEMDSMHQRPPSDKSEALADLAWLLIKEIADKAHIAPTNLISKKSLAYFLDAYIRKQDLNAFPISHGWRQEMVGDLLVKLIEGSLVIKVQNKKIIWQELSS